MGLGRVRVRGNLHEHAACLDARGRREGLYHRRRVVLEGQVVVRPLLGIERDRYDGDAGRRASRLARGVWRRRAPG